MKVNGLVRITKDLELKYNNDKALLQFSVAKNDYKKEGHFYNCVAFGKTAELIAQYFSKGSQIMIYGELWNNNYQNKDGVMIYQDKITVREFEFVDNKSQQEPKPEYQSKSEVVPTLDVTEEMLPF